MRNEEVLITGGYVTYQNTQDGVTFQSYFVVPRAEKRLPTVVILRGVAGPNDGYTQIADRLASAGYAALVHAWQVRGDDPDDTTLVADIKSSLGYLSTRREVDPNRIGVFGYCRGGGQALIAAAECPNIRVVVAFHGFARRMDGGSIGRKNPLELVQKIKQPVLILHGDRDQVSLIDTMRELTNALAQAGTRAEIWSYPEADHGFAVSTHKGFNPAAAQDGFQRAISFLKGHLY